MELYTRLQQGHGEEDAVEVQAGQEVRRPSFPTESQTEARNYSQKNVHANREGSVW